MIKEKNEGWPLAVMLLGFLGYLLMSTFVTNEELKAKIADHEIQTERMNAGKKKPCPGIHIRHDMMVHGTDTFRCTKPSPEAIKYFESQN
jgi:hypothetical protein